MDRLLINPEFEQLWARAGVNSVAEAVTKWLPGNKPQQATVVGRVTLGEGEAQKDAFFKLYQPKGRWRFWLRRSKAAAEFENYRIFQRLGVPAAQPIACGEERDGFGRLLRAFIITRAVPNARQLDEVFRLKLERKERRQIVHQLAETVRQLHHADFFYHDLVWRNILVGNDAAGGRQIFLIDCPRGALARSSRRRKLLRDLASLDKIGSQLCSRSERLQFLLFYLNKKELDDETRELIDACLAYRRTRWPEDWRGK